MNEHAIARPASGPLAWIVRRRSGNVLGFLVCAGLLSYGYYLQYGPSGLQPCPLCIIQRLMLLLTGLAFLAAAMHHPARRWGAHVYGAVIAIMAAIGAGVAGRHVWLQHTPESQRPACGPGLEFLLDTFGPVEVLQRILRGSGECGNVDWTFLGFSIPELTLGAFLVLAAYAVFLSFRD
jgi:disulfide bond formation protein DsbB